MSMHDLRPHVDMWHSFLKLISYSLGGIIVILIGMALFLI